MNIASIDIGTNTVILLIAEITENKISKLLNEFRIPRIGKGLIPGGRINEEKINEFLNIMLDYKSIINQYKCEKIFAIATNAFRIASNSQEILNLIKTKTGIVIEIISGELEAEFSFLGVISDLTNLNSNVLVIDIGGGSTELILGRSDKIIFKKSFYAGVVTGSEIFFKHDPPLNNEIIDYVEYLKIIFKEVKIPGQVKTIAIAGTPTTLACIQKGLSYYNEDNVEGAILKIKDIKMLSDELKHLSSKQISDKYKEIVIGRNDVLLAGTIVLYEIMKLLNLSEVTVSTKGIRYGVIYKNINPNYTP